jgi:hypothetical protein
MIKQTPFIFLLLLFAVAAFAQDEDEEMADTLTAISQVPVVDSGDTSSFDSIGQQRTILVRSVPKKVVDSLKAEDDFWYANLERAKKKPEAQKEQAQNKSLFQKRWFRDLLWFVILSSFVGVVLWYLVSSNILIFRKNPKKIVHEHGTEEETDDIFALNYDKEIAAATEAGNYRLAVRLWYLRTLKGLSDKGLIDYRYGRTNSDYVTQLNKSTYYRDFFRLTRNFEYTWYGQFHLSADAYAMMRNDFMAFNSNLRR